MILNALATKMSFEFLLHDVKVLHCNVRPDAIYLLSVMINGCVRRRRPPHGPNKYVFYTMKAEGEG